jgi:hypothetical protein
MLEGEKGIEEIEKAFSLRMFVLRSQYDRSYLANPKWSDAVVLSSEGERYATLLPEISKYSAHDVKMAVFQSFYHHDLFVDCKRSDLDAIAEILRSESVAGTIRWPFMFGRALYDKFNDTSPPDRIDHFPAGEVFSFLKDTPQGVSQVGHLIAGPLGFVRGKQKRFCPPPASMYLWHCSDPGCRAPHPVSFLPAPSTVTEINNKLDQAAYNAWGPASSWQRSLSDLAEGPHGNRLRTYYDISAIIADCILFEDRTALLQRAFRSEFGEFLRSTLQAAGVAAKGSPTDLAESLDAERQLQLLMALPDSTLVSLIDKCIFDQTFSIPANEERRAVKQMPKRYFIENNCVLSSLGLKQLTDDPLVSLCDMVWDAYSKTGNVNELDWRIRNMNGAATQESLMQFLRNTVPAEAVDQLIFASGPITKLILDELQYTGSLDTPDLIQRVLWKVGFELPRFSDTYSRLRSRLRTFNDTVLQVGSVRSEDDREAIRSAGVNLFVSLEQVLEELVVYNLWLLASDHFLQTEFVFDFDDARNVVSRVLGSKLTSEFGDSVWDNTGVNTLGVLYRYLQEACSWMRKLLSADKKPLRRPEVDLPHYVGKKEGQFVFFHSELWADVQISALGAFVDDFADLAKRLNQANPMQIRNGLDHKRSDEEFPSTDAMLGFVAKFREALDHAELQRYIPKEFWAMSWKQDRAGRREFEFHDYSGRKFAVYEPSLALGVDDIDLNHPILIAPGNLLGHASAALIFRIRDKSNYSEYWKGYPRRRKIPSPDEAAPTAKSVA